MLKIQHRNQIQSGFDQIKIVSDMSLKWDSRFKSNILNLNPKIHEKEIIVSPCADEHWISTDLFKFRIYAEQNNLHVIGICSKNQIPFFSLFCDDVVLVKSDQHWYDEDYSSNGVYHHFKNKTDIEHGSIRGDFKKILDEDVIAKFCYRKICILESSYDKFVSLNLPSDLIVVEFKESSVFPIQDVKNFTLKTVGLDRQFQKDLLKKTHHEDYMSIQILASTTLNWQYLCCGGSGNLMSVIPMKLLSLQDQTIDDSVENIVRSFAEIRYGNRKIPIINRYFVESSGLKGFFKEKEKEIQAASEYLSANKVPYNIFKETCFTN